MSYTKKNFQNFYYNYLLKLKLAENIYSWKFSSGKFPYGPLNGAEYVSV